MVLISLVSVLNLLYFYISTFRSMCAVPNMTVFCSSLTSWLPGMLLTYLLNDFEIIPVASIITGITFVFTFHMHCISIIRSLYFKLLLLLYTAIGLLPGGNGYFTCIQNMKLVTTVPLRNSAVWFSYLWSTFYLLSLLLPFICCASKWRTEWLCLAGVNPCLSVRCQVGEECDINKFGIARCECPPQCEPVMRPVCGEDDRTYESLCELRRASCMQKKLIEVKHTGSCGKTTSVEMWPTTPW